MAIITLNNNSLSSVTALPAGVGGKVLQVISTQVETSVATTSSTTYVEADTNFRVTITPSSASNKILVMASFPIEINNSNESYYTLFRGATDLGAASGKGMFRNYGHDSHANNNGAVLRILDTPNTTSAITYSMKMKVGNAAAVAYYNVGNVSSCISAMEIAV
jgi:hypothetical protein